MQALVNNPGMVRVRLLQAGDTRILEVTVDDDDIGQVVGKGGQTSAALRILVAAMAGRARAGHWQLELPESAAEFQVPKPEHSEATMSDSKVGKALRRAARAPLAGEFR